MTCKRKFEEQLLKENVRDDFSDEEWGDEEERDSPAYEVYQISNKVYKFLSEMKSSYGLLSLTDEQVKEVIHDAFNQYFDEEWRY